MLDSLIKTLIIIGTVSLIYYDKITDDGILTASSIGYRSDFVFLVAVILAIVSVIIKLFKQKIIRITRTEKIILFSWGTLLSFSLIASIISYFVHELSFNLMGIANLGKLILGLILSIVIYVYLKNDIIFFKRLALALYVPPLIPVGLAVLFIVFPDYFLSVFSPFKFIILQYSALDAATSNRFSGLTSNPFQVATGSLVALSFLWPLAMYNLFQRRWVRLFLNVIFVSGLCFSLYLSLVRSSLIALVFILVFGAITMCRKLGKSQVVTLFVLIAFSVIGVATFVSLPSSAKEMYSSGRLGEDSRTAIWEYYVTLSLDNPLGLGFNFEQKFGYKTPYFDLDRPFRPDFPPHNVFLATWTYGGIGALSSLLLFLYVVLKSIRHKLRNTKLNEMPITINGVYYIGSISAFVGIWIISLFTGLPFGDFIHPAVFAMAMAGVASGVGHGNAKMATHQKARQGVTWRKPYPCGDSAPNRPPISRLLLIGAIEPTRDRRNEAS